VSGMGPELSLKANSVRSRFEIHGDGFKTQLML
jgi:hypothetical protein